MTKRCFLKRWGVECARGAKTFIQGGFVSVWPLETLSHRGRGLKSFFFSSKFKITVFDKRTCSYPETWKLADNFRHGQGHIDRCRNLVETLSLGKLDGKPQKEKQ